MDEQEYTPISGVDHIDWQQARANRRGLTRRVSNIFAGHFVSFMGAYSDSGEHRP